MRFAPVAAIFQRAGIVKRILLPTTDEIPLGENVFPPI